MLLDKDYSNFLLQPKVLISALRKSTNEDLNEVKMPTDPASVDRLSKLLSKLIEATASGELHWERQVGSAHRYARSNGNLLILGPAESASASTVPRYLFITPFNSPACIEINSNDEELGKSVLNLVSAVENATAHEPPTDPFAVSGDVLDRLEK